jgi:hypothetical protein
MKIRNLSWALLVSLLAGAGLIAQTGTQPRSVSLRLIVVATQDEATPRSRPPGSRRELYHRRAKRLDRSERS